MQWWCSCECSGRQPVGLIAPSEPCVRRAGPRQSAAVAAVSVLATLLAVTLAWGAAILVRHQRRRRRHDVSLTPLHALPSTAACNSFKGAV